MSDESAGATAAPAPVFEIGHQYIKDLSFEVPGAPKVFETPTTPNVTVNVDVAATMLGQGSYEVALRMDAKGEAGGSPLFLVELVYAGLFRVGNLPEDQIQPLMLIEAPRLLFPFARGIVAGVTRDGGLPPLMITPIDFVALYRRRVAAKAEAAAAKNGGGNA